MTGAGGADVTECRRRAENRPNQIKKVMCSPYCRLYCGRVEKVTVESKDGLVPLLVFW